MYLHSAAHVDQRLWPLSALSWPDMRVVHWWVHSPRGLTHDEPIVTVPPPTLTGADGPCGLVVAGHAFGWFTGGPQPPVGRLTTTNDSPIVGIPTS